MVSAKIHCVELDNHVFIKSRYVTSGAGRVLQGFFFLVVNIPLGSPDKVEFSCQIVTKS